MRERKPDSSVPSRFFSVGFAIAGIVAAALIPVYPQLVVGLAATWIGLWIAGGILWLRTRPKKDKPLDPAAKAELDASLAAANGFLMHPQCVGETYGQPLLAYVNVETFLGDEARNCRGRLVAVTYMAGSRYRRLDIPLAWAQPDNPADPARKTFHGSARLNVAVGDTPNRMKPASAQPLDAVDYRAAAIQRDADNLIGVEITADNKTPTVGWFRLKWWSFERIRQPDGTDLHYDLRYAHIEFEKAPDA